MPVTKRKQSSYHSNRQVQPAVFHEFFAVQVPSAESWRKGGLHARLIGGHSYDAHERAHAKRLTKPVMSQALVWVQGPHRRLISSGYRDHRRWATWGLCEAQPFIHLA